VPRSTSAICYWDVVEWCGDVVLHDVMCENEFGRKVEAIDEYKQF